VHGALAMCGALAEWDAQPCAGDEPLSAALQRARRVQHGASRVLLVSDGWSCDEAAHGRLLDLSRQAAVRVLIVSDALELAPPPPGRYPLEHAGTQREVSLLTDRERRDFQAGMGAGRVRLLATARTLGLPARQIDTAADPCDAVASLLRAGGRRR
jgi:hypothetical protein